MQQAAALLFGLEPSRALWRAERPDWAVILFDLVSSTRATLRRDRDRYRDQPCRIMSDYLQ